VQAKSARIAALASAIGLYVGWLAVYLCSLDLHGKNIDCENFLFDADPTRVIKVVTKIGVAHSTERHPLYVSFLKPLGFFVMNFTNDVIIASLVVTAALAAIAVPFAFLMMRRSSRGIVDGILWTMVFAGSSAFWFFAALPETFAINAASIAIGYVLQLLPGGEPYAPKAFRRIFLLHVLFGVFATGMTLTNSVYALISFCSLAWKQRPAEKWKRFLVTRVLLYMACVTVLLSSLSSIQTCSYPNAHRFLAPNEYTSIAQGDKKYVTLHDEGAWLLTEGRTMIGSSIIGPHAEVEDVVPEQFGKPEHWTAVQFSSEPGWMWWASTAFALAFTVALGVRARGKYASTEARDWRPEIGMSIAIIGFNLMLHSFYRAIGIPFMYSVHVTFPIVFLLSLLYGRSTLPGKRVLLAVLAVSVIATNASFLGDISDALRIPDIKRFRFPPEGPVLAPAPPPKPPPKPKPKPTATLKNRRPG
jgi:hypothetical protein